MNKITDKKIKILIAEHDKNDLEILEHELIQGGFNYESKIVQTENDFSNALDHFVPDIILSDYTFPSFDGPAAFKIRERLAPGTPFIFVSGTVGEETVVELIKSGVTDYALKDKLFTLPNKINRALRDSEKAKQRTLDVKEHEKMVSDIIQRSKNMEQFTYIISHNLRAPIANILGIANVLKGNVTDPDRIKIQQFLFTAVAKLDETVKDLNKILQIQSEITESKESVNLLEMVQVIKSSIQNLVQKEKAEILTDFSFIDKLTTIKSYLHSIFYNLISNSIKYKQPDKPPVIRIKSYINNNKTFISFKDNGTGIDLKLQGDKVFGLYKRFHDNIEGKGLGLFMVKTQVEVLGGSINVKSELGIGTEFIIEFPNL